MASGTMAQCESPFNCVIEVLLLNLRASVVRTSVFDWRTFPDLWLRCDQFVGKVCAVGQPTRRTQPSIYSGSVN